MRLLLLCLAIGLAGAKIEEKAYRPEREYLYLYYTQVVSGLPGLSAVYSSIQVKTLVRAQFVTASRVKAALENVVLYRYNEEIESGVPTNKILPSRIMIPITGPIATNLTTELLKPFEFDYVAGHVANLRTEADDLHFSVNLKRGLVSLFEVNLEQRFSLEKNATKADFSTTAATYKCMDPSPMGLIETVYTVVPYKSIPTAYHVVKARNYTNVMRNYFYRKSNVATETCSTFEGEERPISAIYTGVSHVRYSIYGDKTKFLISSAIAESKYTIPVHGKTNGRIETSVNQTLTLIDAMDIKSSTPIPAVASPIKRKLTAFVPEMAFDPLNPFSNDTEHIASRAGHLTFTKEKVLEVLTLAATYMDDNVNIEASRYVGVTVDILRNTEPYVIEEVMKQYITPTKPTETIAKNIRTILIQVLPVVGTSPVAKLIVRELDIFPPKRRPYVLGSLALAVEPNVHVMKMLMEMVSSNKVEAKTRRAAVLAIGTFTWKLQKMAVRYREMLAREMNFTRVMLATEDSKVAQAELNTLKNSIEERLSQTGTLTNALIQEVVSTLRTLLTKADVEEKILALKAIGNAGLIPMITDVESILVSPTVSPIVRAQAAFSLRRIAPWLPEKAVHVLMPVITSYNTPTMVRLAAFDALVLSRPSLPIWQTIAQHLRFEPDMQFSSYVGSVLRTLANSTNPCFARMSSYATAAITSTVVPLPGIQYSKYYSYGKQYVKGGRRLYGGSVSFGYFGTNTSIVPQAAAITVSGNFFNRYAQLFEVGYNTEGLQAILDKWFGPKGLLTSRKSLFDVLSRAARSVTSNAKIEEIFSKLGITERTEPAPSGHVYYKFNGDEVMYYPLTSILREVISTGKLSSRISPSELKAGKTVDVRRSWILADIRKIIPTECGLPIHLGFTATNILIASGTVAASVNPAMMESARKGSPPIAVEAKVDANISNAMEMLIRMHISGFVLESGVAVRSTSRSHLPIKASVTLDLEKNKVFSEITPPVSTEPLYTLDMAPLTYVNIIPASPEHGKFVRNAKYIERTANTKLMPVFYNVTRGSSGLKLTLAGRTATRGINKPWYACPVFGYTNLYLIASSAKTSPTPVTVEIAFTSAARNESSVAKSSSCSSIFSKLTMCLWQDSEPSESPEASSSVDVESSSVQLADFSNLKKVEISIASLRSKLKAKIKDVHALSALGRKWGFVAVVKSGETPVIHTELMWVRGERGFTHQFAGRFVRASVPELNVEPKELLIHSEVKYPKTFVLPETLFEPSYLTQLQNNMKFILQHKSHHALLKSMETTALTTAARRVYPVEEDPLATIERAVVNIAAVSKNPALKSWAPILSQLIMNVNYVRDTFVTSLNPFNFFIREAETIDLFNKQATLFEAVNNKTARLTRNKNVNAVENTLAQFAILKQKQILIALAAMAKDVSNIVAFTKGEELWAKTLAMIRTFQATISPYFAMLEEHNAQFSSDVMNSPAIGPLVKLTKLQAGLLKTLASSYNASIPTEPLISSARETLESIVKVRPEELKVNSTISVNLMTQAAIKHQIIKQFASNAYVYKFKPALSSPSEILKLGLFEKVANVQTRLLGIKALNVFYGELSSLRIQPTLMSADKQAWIAVTEIYNYMVEALAEVLTIEAEPGVEKATAKLTRALELARKIATELETVTTSLTTSPTPPSIPVVVALLTASSECKQMISKVKVGLMNIPTEIATIQELNAINMKINTLMPYLSTAIKKYAESAPSHAEESHVFLSKTPMRSVDLKMHELMEEVSMVRSIVSRMSSMSPAQILPMCEKANRTAGNAIREMRAIMKSGALFEKPSHSPEMFSGLASSMRVALSNAEVKCKRMSPKSPRIESELEMSMKEVEKMIEEFHKLAAEHHIPRVSESPVPKIRTMVEKVSELRSIINRMPSEPKSTIKKTCTEVSRKIENLIPEIRSFLTSGVIWTNPSSIPEAENLFSKMLREFQTTIITAKTESSKASAPKAMETKIDSFLAEIRKLITRYHAEVEKHRGLSSAGCPTTELTKLLVILTAVEYKVKTIPTLTSSADIKRDCTYINENIGYALTEMNTIVTSDKFWNYPIALPITTRLFKTLYAKLKTILTLSTNEASQSKNKIPSAVTAQIQKFQTETEAVWQKYQEEAKRHNVPPSILHADADNTPTTDLTNLLTILAAVETKVKTIPTLNTRTEIKSTCTFVTEKIRYALTKMNTIVTSETFWSDKSALPTTTRIFKMLCAKLKTILTESTNEASQFKTKIPSAVTTQIQKFQTETEAVWQKYQEEAKRHNVPPSILHADADNTPATDLTNLLTILAAVETKVKTIPTLNPRTEIKSACTFVFEKIRYALTKMNTIVTSETFWSDKSALPTTTRIFKMLCAKLKTILTESTNEASQFKTKIPSAMTTQIQKFQTETEAVWQKYQEEAKRQNIPLSLLHADNIPATELTKLSTLLIAVEAKVKTIPTLNSRTEIKSACTFVTEKIRYALRKMNTIVTYHTFWSDKSALPTNTHIFKMLCAKLKTILSESTNEASQFKIKIPSAVTTQIQKFQTETEAVWQKYQEEAKRHHVPPSQRLYSVPPHSGSPSGIVGFINVEYGSSSPSPYLNFKIYGSKSVEQILSELSQIDPFAQTATFRKSLMEGTGPARIMSASKKWIVELNVYRHIHIMASSPNPASISPRVKRVIYWIRNALVARYYKNLVSIPTPADALTPNKLSALIIYRANNERMLDMSVSSPKETAIFTGLRICPLVWSVFPISGLPRRTLIKGTMTYWKLPAQCEWTGPLVRTFDTAFIPVPKLGTCPAVLAMDCSPSKSFAVIARPTVMPAAPRAVWNASKVIEIWALGHVIEIVPSSSEIPTVMIDGTVKSVTMETPIVIEKTLSYNRPAVAIKIMVMYKSHQKMIMVDLPVIGLTVMTNAYYVQVSPSVMFRGKTCGLCSNFDGQITKELQGPTGSVFESAVTFARSYIVNNGSCSAAPIDPDTPASTVYPEVEPSTMSPSPVQFSRDGPACAPVERTVVKTRSKGKRACFSLKPVAECPSGCRFAARNKKRVEFTCMNASTSETQKLIADAERRVLTEVVGKPVTFSIIMKNAEKCQKA